MSLQSSTGDFIKRKIKKDSHSHNACAPGNRRTKERTSRKLNYQNIGILYMDNLNINTFFAKSI